VALSASCEHLNAFKIPSLGFFFHKVFAVGRFMRADKFLAPRNGGKWAEEKSTPETHAGLPAFVPVKEQVVCC
jgi:hypothetical protein